MYAHLQVSFRGPQGSCRLNWAASLIGYSQRLTFDVGGCQNYGPYLVPPVITQKGTFILTTTHVGFWDNASSSTTI